jgi:hypothetical protein
MSSFLVNLARRGAGLPVTPIQAPPPSPFGPEIRKQGDELTEAHEAARGLRMAEELATGNAASQSPLPASSSEECMELPSEAPTHPTPSIQRLSGAVPGTLIQPSIGEPAATTRTPSPGPVPAPQRHVIPPMREAGMAPMEPPKDFGPAVPPFHEEREVVTEIEAERGRHTPSPAAQEIEPVGEPPRHASSVAPGLPIIIREPGERQVVAPAELSAERPLDRVQKTPEPTLPAPTIRPALAESHTLLQFPKVTPASSPTPPAQLPIHVRIGRVEVHATSAPTPTPATPSLLAPLGFDGYYRVRNYRS